MLVLTARARDFCNRNDGSVRRCTETRINGRCAETTFAQLAV
jgi:hypothetical protein